jgi:hypothetical protein
MNARTTSEKEAGASRTCFNGMGWPEFAPMDRPSMDVQIGGNGAGGICAHHAVMRRWNRSWAGTMQHNSRFGLGGEGRYVEVKNALHLLIFLVEPSDNV